MYQAKVIEDSISSDGIRLTTMQLLYPRYIHAELLTHRVFSRNASSSRAIPVAKLAQSALDDMVEPIRFGLNQPGMQASESCLEGESLDRAKKIWRDMAETCARGAQELSALGLHKQWANRPLEWFSYISTIVTATEWKNFFELRDHPDAQPEIHDLAAKMKLAMGDSTPRLLKNGEWHLPYVSAEERAALPLETAIRISAARAARVSYLTHDGQTPDIEKDVALYERLVGSVPLHASPIEHQATPDVMQTSFIGDESGDMDDVQVWKEAHLHGNFNGWIQFRKIVELQSQ